MADGGAGWMELDFLGRGAPADGSGQQMKPPPAAKRETRGRKPKNKEELEALYLHFRLLGKKYVGKTGKEQPHPACVCIWCEKADEEALAIDPFHTRKSVEMARYRAKLESHLKKCEHFQASQTSKILPQKKRSVDAVAADSNFASIAPPAVPAPPSKKLARSPLPTLANRTSPAQIAMRGPYKAKVETALTEMLVDNGLPFRLVNSDSFGRFCDILRPGSSRQLPKRDKVQTVLLKSVAEEARESQEKHIARGFGAGHKAGMTTSTWPNINKTVYLEGVTLTVGASTFSIKSLETAAVEQHAIAVARGWESLLFNTFKYDFRYFTSRDAGQCGGARRILALRHPYILWMRCWAEQINFMVKGLMQRENFTTVAKQAVAASAAIKMSSEWSEKLRDECTRLYGKDVPCSVATADKSLWSSMQSCFASQLRIKGACEVFAVVYGNQFPTELQVWRSQGFWSNLAEAEHLIRPLCEASQLTRHLNQNTMAHVLLVLLNLSLHIIENCGGNDDAAALLVDVERRWKREDNPLFFLAFALHPLYRWTAVALLKAANKKYGNWESGKNPLSVARFKQAVKFYYQKYELDKGQGENKATDLGRLAKHLGKWLRGENIEVDMYDTGENLTEYWIAQSDEFPELGKFAAFLFDCSAQADSCGRVFEEFQRQQTKEPGRQPGPEQRFQMAVIKSNLSRKYPDAKSKKGNGLLMNKIMSAKEHTRLNTEEGLEDETVSRAGVKQEDEMHEKGEEYESDPDIDPEVDVIKQWQEALDWAAEEEQVDHGQHEEGSARNAGDDSSDDEEKLQCFEQRRAPLDPLPEEADPDYPQENAAYFSQQKRKYGEGYIRADKYTLKLLCELCRDLPEDAKPPRIMSAYWKFNYASI